MKKITVFHTNATADFRSMEIPRLYVIATFALLLACASLRAGSIFDDDFPLAKSSAPSASPPQPAPTTPAPTPPATPPTTPVETSKPAAPIPPEGPTVHARLPVPSNEPLSESRKNLKIAFAADLKDASVAARKSLAQKLLAECEKSEYSPTDRFALLSGALQSAVEGQSVPQAFQAIDKMSELFNINALLEKAEFALDAKMKFRAQSKPGTIDNIHAGLQLADSLIMAEGSNDEDFLRRASRLIQKLRESAQDDPGLTKSIRLHGERVSNAVNSLHEIQPSLKTLAQSPSDPAANLAVGRHYCLKVGQWKKGLVYLSRGSDASLKGLADRELSSGEPIKLADDWWEQAKGKTPEALAMKLHAAELYRSVQSSASGLAAKKIETRLSEVTKIAADSATGTSGMASSGTHQDLLALVDPSKNTIEGDWELKGGILRGVGGNNTIEFPYEPPEEYDYRIVFTRQNPKFSGFRQLFTVNGHRFAFEIFDEGSAKIQYQNNHEVIGAVPKNLLIAVGQRCTLVAKVRKDHFEAFLDGVSICRLTTDYSDLTMWRGQILPHPKTIGLVVFRNYAAIEAAVITEVNGVGVILKPPG